MSLTGFITSDTSCDLSKPLEHPTVPTPPPSSKVSGSTLESKEIQTCKTLYKPYHMICKRTSPNQQIFLPLVCQALLGHWDAKTNTALPSLVMVVSILCLGFIEN